LFVRHDGHTGIIVSSMDLIDGPSPDSTNESSTSSTPHPQSESRMRRLSKIIVFIAACSAAMVITVIRHDDGIRVGADNQLRAATRTVTGKYDLGQLPIFSKTLFYVRENYFDKNRDRKRTRLNSSH